MTDSQIHRGSQILSCRIFVIGRTATDLDVMKKVLEKTGYTSVTVVDDIPRATAPPHLWRPDLMLLELTDPDEPRSALVTRLRAAVPAQDVVPMLVLAADTAPEARGGLLRHGASDVLTKPLVPEELLARVGTLLTARVLHQREQRLAGLLERTRTEKASSAQAEAGFLHAMVDSMQECVLACDADGGLMLANAAAARLGLDRIGSGPGPRLTPGLLRSVTGTPLSADDDPLQRAWHGEDVVGQEVTLEDPRQGRRVMEANAHQILIDPGTRLGAVVVLHDITEMQRVTQSLRRQVLNDDLTGLPNRVLFLDRLERSIAKAQRDHRPFAVMMLSVRPPSPAGPTTPDDALDTAAHEAILTASAQRLLMTLRPGDTSARLGDGFGVLCAAPVSESNARVIAERLRAELCRPVPVSDGRVTPELHIGIVIVRDAGVLADQVLRDAHAAALEAGKLGGSRHQLRDCVPRQTFLEQLDIVADLRDALPGSELSVHYQPMVDLASGDIVGVEALARWRRSGQGPVSPSQFIPVAAHHGFLAQIDSWVLMTTCHQLAVWLRAQVVDDRFVVSVNVSADGLMTPGWVDQVVHVLQITDVDPSHLVLEVTPSVVTSEPALAIRQLQALRSRGVRLALDDVDAADGSLAQLPLLPVEMIKMGGDLVSEVSMDEAFTAVARVIDLSHGLGKAVVAEGVETADQASALISLGCDLAQGRYFSQPLPADRMTVLLRPARNSA